MELNDQVQVTLTKAGANIINSLNVNFQKEHPQVKVCLKTDYKEGDILSGQLWSIIDKFTGKCSFEFLILFCRKIYKINYGLI